MICPLVINQVATELEYIDQDTNLLNGAWKSYRLSLYVSASWAGADDEKVQLLCHKKNTEAYSLPNTHTCMEMKVVEPRNKRVSAQTTLITYVSCVCARARAFILGHERIGHALFVAAAVGVLPASVPLSGIKNRPVVITDACFDYITSRRE